MHLLPPSVVRDFLFNSSSRFLTIEALISHLFLDLTKAFDCDNFEYIDIVATYKEVGYINNA